MQYQLRANQQQIELLDRTIAQGVAPDRVALVRLALANARVRAGDAAGAMAISSEVGPDEPRAVVAALDSLRGALELADGEVGRVMAKVPEVASARTKSPATAVPPLSVTTCFITINFGAMSSLVIVQA